MPVQFQTGVGRLVWGHPLKRQAKKGDDGKPIIGQDGKPETEIAFGVAFPKPEFIQLVQPKVMEAIGQTFGGNVPQNFAWKYVDGDASTGHTQGKPFNERTGYPGCFVMTFKTLFDIPAFKQSVTMPGTWDQITADALKTGDYIAVSGAFEAHQAKNARARPGLYTNPQGVLLIGVGEAIMNAPDAAQMFGGMQYQLPPGATMPGAAPAMPAGMANPPGMPGGGAPGYGAPMPGGAPQQPPGAQYPGGPAPGGYPMPGQAPAPAPQYAPPGGAPQQQPPGYPPAYDIAGGQAPGMPGNGYAPQVPGGAPMMAPGGYAPTPATPATGYPSNPQPGYGAPPGYPPQR